MSDFEEFDPCSECKGQGVVPETRRAPGWARMHNERVRNYRGGPRPNVHDFDQTVFVKCPRCKGSGDEGE